MRKRKRDRKTVRKPEKPKEKRSKLSILEKNRLNTAPYSNDQGEPRGMARAVVTFDELLRRPPYRDVLRDINRLARSNKKDGKA